MTFRSQAFPRVVVLVRQSAYQEAVLDGLVFSIGTYPSRIAVVALQRWDPTIEDPSTIRDHNGSHLNWHIFIQSQLNSSINESLFNFR